MNVSCLLIDSLFWHLALQLRDRWFIGPVGLRSFSEMVDVYHNTVGRNCLLELDFTPDRNGMVPASYAARYRQLGSWIRACYGSPVAPAQILPGSQKGEFVLAFDHPIAIDRVVLQEDQSNGQVIRSFSLFAKILPEPSAKIPSELPWTPLSSGKSVGNKRIVLLPKAITITTISVNTTFVDTPILKAFQVHLCDTLVSNSTHNS